MSLINLDMYGYLLIYVKQLNYVYDGGFMKRYLITIIKIEMNLIQIKYFPFHNTITHSSAAQLNCYVYPASTSLTTRSHKNIIPSLSLCSYNF